MRQCLVLGFTAHPGSGRVGSGANSSTEKALASFHSVLLCSLSPFLSPFSGTLRPPSLLSGQRPFFWPCAKHVLHRNTLTPQVLSSPLCPSISPVWFTSRLHQNCLDLRNWKFWEWNLGICILMSFLHEFMHDKAWESLPNFSELFFCFVFNGEGI